MDIVVDKKDFLISVQEVAGVIGKNNVMPILSYMLIKTENDSISIFATDLQVGIKSICPAEIKTEGEILLPTKKILGLVKELPQQDINIFIKNNNIYLKCQKHSTKIPIIATSDYPETPTMTGLAKKITFESDLLKDIILKTIFSVSDDPSAPVLNNIFLEINKQNLNAVSTDGHRMSLVRTYINNESDFNVLIPTKTAIEIIKIIDLEAPVFVELELYENHFIFKTKNIVIYSRLLSSSTYPKYENILPESDNSETNVVLNKISLLTALKRVSLLADEKSKTIELDITQNEFKIFAENNGKGESSEIIDIDLEMDNLKIGVNAAYLIDILKHSDYENYVLTIVDSKNPLVIKPENSNDYTCLIMPIHL